MRVNVSPVAFRISYRCDRRALYNLPRVEGEHVPLCVQQGRHEWIQRAFRRQAETSGEDETGKVRACDNDDETERRSSHVGSVASTSMIALLSLDWLGFGELTTPVENLFVRERAGPYLAIPPACRGRSTDRGRHRK